MTIEDHIKYWIDSAENDILASESMYKSKRYDWCLFIGHLVLEKTIKAIFVKNNNNEIPPKIHDLIKLSEKAKLRLTEDKEKIYDQINGFNIEARYPEYKKEFYKRCTVEFTTNYFEIIKNEFKWLKTNLK